MPFIMIHCIPEHSTRVRPVCRLVGPWAGRIAWLGLGQRKQDYATAVVLVALALHVQMPETLARRDAASLWAAVDRYATRMG